MIAAGSAAASAPATYESFEKVTGPSADSLQLIKDELENGTGVTALYLGPGDYTLDNPVVIDRTGSVYIHGSGRGQNTRLIAQDPAQPLFQIDAATVVNFANLSLTPTLDFYPRCVPGYCYPEGESPDLAAQAVLMKNTLPVSLEIQFCDVEGGYLDIKGPGSIRLESTLLDTNGLMRAGALVDHPEADFISIGTGFSGGALGTIEDLGDLPNYDEDDPEGALDFYHVWALQGRVQIYSATTAHALGRADFRFDSASALGPHVVAQVRTEFSHDRTINSHAPILVYVPPRDLPIDVLMKSNEISTPGTSGGALIDYNAAGTVWLLGNDGKYDAEKIAVGDAPNATLIAIGNEIWAPLDSPLFETTATRGRVCAQFRNRFNPWTREISDVHEPGRDTGVLFRPSRTAAHRYRAAHFAAAAHRGPARNG